MGDMELNKEYLQRIKERVAKATEGPWRLGPHRGFGEEHDVETVDGRELNGVRGMFYYPADAEFVAHAREDMPTLIRAVEQLMDKVDRRGTGDVAELSAPAFRRDWDSEDDTSYDEEDADPICKLCGHPVVKNRERYDVFGQMHWLCFHIVFEHMGSDSDEPCKDPDCPWRQMEAYRAELQRLGINPDELTLWGLD